MSESMFAQVDENNIVTNVAVVTKEFLEANPDRYTGRWIETSGTAIGFTYIEETKEFRQPQPFPSWTWVNEAWTPPVPYPIDIQNYRWSESALDWIEV